MRSNKELCSVSFIYILSH